MKNILLVTIILAINVTCFAQTEPESVRGKELLEKMDRSELEIDGAEDSMGLDDEIPKMKIPKLDFNKDTDKESPVKKAPVKKVLVKEAPVKEAPVKETPVKETSVKETPVKETPVEKPAVEKAPITQANTKIEEPSNESNNQKSNKIMISNRRLSINSLDNNDSLVKTDGITYVYRLVKNDMVQFKFIGAVPENSAGLKSLGNDNYVVIDTSKLDEEKQTITKVNVVNKPVVEAPKPEATKPEVKNPVEKKVVAVTQPEPQSKVDKIKSELELEHNHGEKITESITIDKLLKNDMIYISGDVQLVIRRNRNTYDIENYWLIEDLDLNLKSLSSTSYRALSNNRFKVTKDHEPKK